MYSCGQTELTSPATKVHQSKNKKPFIKTVNYIFLTEHINLKSPVLYNCISFNNVNLVNNVRILVTI